MNKLRVATLTALILALVAGGLPVTQSLARWSRGAAVSTRKKKGKYRRRSRAWWRRHRARVRARRERAARRRQQLAAWRTSNPGLPVPSALAPVGFRSAGSDHRRRAAPELPRAAAARPALLPFEFPPPHNWVAPRRTAPGELTFTLRGTDGRAAGTAVVAPVALQADSAAASPRAKNVGGVSVTSLRRTVIDRMVAAGGWVTNDFVKETGGRRVFVVLAQTGAPGAPAQSLTYYFTEIEGRVYSLATTAPVEIAAPVAAGSEQFMASIRPTGTRNLATQK